MCECVYPPLDETLTLACMLTSIISFSSTHSSMVIRDLTLRSAASFGSFHLIRLLYDEYMFFLIEHKVAKATGRTPIAVMSEVCLFVCLFVCFLSQQGLCGREGGGGIFLFSPFYVFNLDPFICSYCDYQFTLP